MTPTWIIWDTLFTIWLAGILIVPGQHYSSPSLLPQLELVSQSSVKCEHSGLFHNAPAPLIRNVPFSLIFLFFRTVSMSRDVSMAWTFQDLFWWFEWHITCLEIVELGSPERPNSLLVPSFIRRRLSAGSPRPGTVRSECCAVHEKECCPVKLQHGSVVLALIAF